MILFTYDLVHPRSEYIENELRKGFMASGANT